MLGPILLVCSGLIIFAAFVGPKIGAKMQKAHNKPPPIHEMFTGPRSKPIAQVLAKGAKAPGKYTNENLRKGLSAANRVIKRMENDLAQCQAKVEALENRIANLQHEVGSITDVERIDCEHPHCEHYDKQLDMIENRLAVIAGSA